MGKIIIAKEYTYDERKKAIAGLCEKYPFIKKSNIGKSCMGKDITALKIGSADEYSLTVAAIHGSERITATVLLMFIEELCDSLSSDGSIAGFNAKRAMWGRGAIFVPCVNPDGCDIALLGKTALIGTESNIAKLCNNDFTHWNANFRGVDINHNFDAGWKELHELEIKNGIFGPAATRYGGRYPESEPETAALTELCRKNRIRHVTALHSQGEVIYWNYGKKEPPRAKKMAEIMATSSGYALDVPIGIANGGGFKDWFIEKFNRPGFTVEIGLGENPLESYLADTIYTRIKEMLTLSIIM